MSNIPKNWNQQVIELLTVIAGGELPPPGGGTPGGGGSGLPTKQREIGGGLVSIPAPTSGSMAIVCPWDQPCLYAIVAAPSPRDASGMNTAEVRVLSGNTTVSVTANACWMQGRSMLPANYEGLIVRVSNMKFLQFTTETGKTAGVRVTAVVEDV